MAEIQANLQSPLSCLVEDGDCRCHHDLGIPCDGSNFFLHSVRRNAVLSLHFKPKPKSSKTLQSLLMRLVIVKSVSISKINGITTTPPIKVLVPLLGHYFILQSSKLFLSP